MALDRDKVFFLPPPLMPPEDFARILSEAGMDVVLYQPAQSEPGPGDRAACILGDVSGGREALDAGQRFIRDRRDLAPATIFLSSSGLDEASEQPFWRAGIFDVLEKGAAKSRILGNVKNALASDRFRRERYRLVGELEVRRMYQEKLNRIGYSLSAVADIDTLLHLILSESRDMLNADGGSIYLVLFPDEEGGERRLLFKAAQNDSVDFRFESRTMPLDTRSIAGYVALTGEILNLRDVYALPADEPYTFNRKFDEDLGYRTMSMLAIPLVDRDKEVIGVLSLVNRKAKKSAKVRSVEDARNWVVPFDATTEEIAQSIASQAAVSIENARLYNEVKTLFDGFVQASVTAIEARDPTTGGHSFRVARLSVALAEKIDAIDAGPLGGVHFTRDEIVELNYAALLHDFGKVGVREKVLVKANKLYDEDYMRVVDRLRFARERTRTLLLERKLMAASEQGRDADSLLGAIDAEMQARMREIDDFIEFVAKVNLPFGTKGEDLEKLKRMAAAQFRDWDGRERPLLEEKEHSTLSLASGSLTPEERREIESHVIHTFQFLSKIPWTRKLRRVPRIAYAHHEKLDGTGYPLKLPSEEIPIESKIMSVADIFDALTASDRPYKKAMTAERAIQILEAEAKQNHVDGDILKVLVDAKLYETILKR